MGHSVAEQTPFWKWEGFWLSVGWTLVCVASGLLTLDFFDFLMDPREWEEAQEAVLRQFKWPDVLRIIDI
ncbi:MAG: hypothetical protein NDI90_05840 [Nitrospira sp. BO4]|jgi:hypothetical protein|nr:hypothetical protein [Nitrospira sp. BO4]